MFKLKIYVLYSIFNSILIKKKLKFQAMFEIITSEASYLKSLSILINVFLMSQEFSAEHSDKCVINRQERHVLFSNIGAVREASER
jgi:SH3 domain-containing guanine exchange factor